MKDIARGMKHLQHEKIVHRDLSARNILVTDAKNGWVSKVSDFGLSRFVPEENDKGKTESSVGPLKWMSPESLMYKTYSVKSDIWSYGVTVIEVLNMGNEPYNDLDAVQAASGVMYKNLKPTTPEDCPLKLAQLLEQCFFREPEKRPDFKYVLGVLDEVESDIKSNPFYVE